MTSGLYNDPLFRVYGDQGLLMEFGSCISPKIHEVVRSMAIALEKNIPSGIIEFVPTYRAITVHYDALVTSFEELKVFLTELFENLNSVDVPSPRIVELPVCYGGDLGPDLEFVASSHNMSVEEVIKIHSELDYLIYMIGFTPGFPFLGGLSELLHTPRLDSPRKKVVAGSVGIANDQTGVYPVDSPGGWQLIGRVPIKLFNPDAEKPFLLSSGDILKFKPISEAEFVALSSI